MKNRRNPLKWGNKQPQTMPAEGAYVNNRERGGLHSTECVQIRYSLMVLH